MLLNRLASWVSRQRFSTNSVLRDTKSAPGADNGPIVNLHRVTDWERKILVFSGKFKSTADVPEKLSMDFMQNAFSKARIRLCNVMIVITVVGAAYVIFSAKSEHKKEILNEGQLQQDAFRRQMAQEYKASMSKEAPKTI